MAMVAHVFNLFLSSFTKQVGENWALLGTIPGSRYWQSFVQYIMTVTEFVTLMRIPLYIFPGS